MERLRPIQSQGLYDPSQEHDSCGFGFVVDTKGRPSHDIVRKALQVLCNLEHRGASGSEKSTGDGAGILTQIPHAFLASRCGTTGLELPAPGDYGVGMLFLPPDDRNRHACEQILEEVTQGEGQRVLGWRDVPTDNAHLGVSARASQPVIRQVFIGRGTGTAAGDPFERKLYVIRRLAEKRVSRSVLPGRGHFYLSSLSCRTIVYKGMLNSEQLGTFYPDLGEETFASGLGMVHSRFSTNTFPSWSRAHPYRYISHNGEINTLRGNVNWMEGRQRLFASRILGEDLQKVLPVIDLDGSDSSMFDNVLELLYMAGRSLPHALMMMVPEPWSRHESMSPLRKAFYEFHSCMMEPWDGPASIAFTDGTRIGAILDRNGLRPARWILTKDGLVVMASETGVLDIPAEKILQKGRVQPGRMFLVDTGLGRIVPDDELKDQLASAEPYAQWVKENLVRIDDLPEPPRVNEPDHETVLRRQETFGYTLEDVNMIVNPMAADGAEPIGSMGSDIPLAVLSEKPQLLFDYFKQLFAQVTNPPVDADRESIVLAVDTAIGPEGNLLEPTAASALHFELHTPVLLNRELEKIRGLNGGPGSRGFRSITLPMLFKADAGGKGLRKAIEDLRRHCSEAIAEGHNILILSDRGHDATDAPIPALLGIAAIQHHLLRAGDRERVCLVLESGEPREVHHFCTLIGYGASAINPYLAFETIHDQLRQGMLSGEAKAAEKSYVKAVNKGIVKVMSKMGISAVQSYHGAQIFEALGLSQDFVDEYFSGTPTRIGGVGIDVIAKEVALRHDQAYPERPADAPALSSGGRYKYRRDGEAHLNSPEAIHLLQSACRTGDYKLFKRYTELIDHPGKQPITLRGLLDFRSQARPVPLEEVEPIESILARFKTGAMSYGSISQEAHEALAIAMNRIGGKSNTGEGGEDPARYERMANGDSKNSAIKQVASGRFGVTSQYLVEAQEIQIKMAQGAKPGEGGQLPGPKVYPWIAKVRHATPGVGLISPPPHHDIYSIEDLAQLIHDLKNANPGARISVKLVSESGVGTIAAGVAKAHADVILISGFDGGTGAASLTSIRHAGAPWELGLAEAQQVLVMNNLRSRVVLEADGQLKSGRDVIVAALLGAEEFGFATGALLALGCVMMRACHKNTCPVGVATQDPELRKRFTGDPQHVVNFMRFIAMEVRELMAQLGYRQFYKLVGRSEHLEMRRGVDHWKARTLDFTRMLWKPSVARDIKRTFRVNQDHGLEKALDATTLIPLCRPAIEARTPVSATLPISNVNRTVGTMLGSEITRRWGVAGLPDDTIRLQFQGSAGQSFGAFIPRGLTLSLEGDANDYLGKGLSGGRIAVFPPRTSTFVPEENVVIGNVACYGATSGEAYIRGLAGERFCVRNSGATAVVEGIGDHGCEYMTGGEVVILGRAGRNFGAGMSGGIAWVLDETGDFPARSNLDLVGMGPIGDPLEAEHLKDLITRHATATQSKRAITILRDWEQWLPRFVRVMPHDYERVLASQARMREKGLSEDEAVLAAFEENARSLSRADGN
ncbi:MAG: glutamate synthase large subunit [Holophagaceae bacterium]|uniref:Glutamate synthase [NADPH] large chain n=1 Tax=Candidatus Geothrix skivensis TaxID=2954439 RepID=A0A9D7SGQ5_9BACT|nr:glutamate synthase large subunit [Candidatus Geothrix skivensis]